MTYFLIPIIISTIKANTPQQERVKKMSYVNESEAQSEEEYAYKAKEELRMLLSIGAERAQIEKEVKQRISESKEKNKTRHRCLVAGCNPYLENAEKATEHKNKTGHRTAKWPVRSEEGKRLAKERINGNYYKKYRGAKKIGTTWIIP